MNAKRTGKPVFFVVLILILALAFTAFFGISNYYGDTKVVYTKGANDIRWGIDIKGGVEAVFSPDKADVDITTEDMDAAKAIIETRLVNNNITDYEVFADNDNHQIIVRFPWASGESDFDAAKAVKELGETAMLTFCEGETNETVIMTGTHVEKATPGVDEQNNYVVYLDLDAQGTSTFAAATKKLLNKTISIWMDETLLSAPTVNTVIDQGTCYISGMADAEQATDLANKINAGSLPFALTVDDSKLQIISPTLGSNALQVMVIAGSIAFAFICLLMILRYRLNGVVAAIALLGQLAGSIACISGYFRNADSFTLTIPGIAGIILSIGVGVDCNVIAAERIRDEFKKGKTIDGAIDSGYKNSLSAIIDGNVTITIVSIVLMGAFGTPDSLLAKIFAPLMSLFGTQITGSIYSFGYTLLVGTIFNLIMGVYASKLMLKSISQYKALRNPWLYGGNKNA
jgi:protein-export SecD/SecF family membrane protein